ncbi:DNA adenine methylase [Pseudovibrio ascidiaceicola]|uniref:DNA adenine methylase n=1 Tax=Pseudovibrio ascidiaceicola TaxID=285279 RepID=UPI003D35AB51
MDTVTPVKPALPYIGGKRALAKHISARIAQIPHTSYVEPFVGMGGVFFRKTTKAKCEIINDISKDVACFFRVIQRHYKPFLEQLRFQLSSREHFEQLKKADPDTLTDLERSARFFYLQSLSFGGKVAGRTFGVSLGRPARFDPEKIEKLLQNLHKRLSWVVIECLPYSECIRRYDRPDTLFYLDPPYWGVEDYYGKNVFSAADFEALAKQLRQVEGRFLFSINNTPEIREIFAGFDFEEVSLKYTAGSGAAKEAQELIISN